MSTIPALVLHVDTERMNQSEDAREMADLNLSFLLLAQRMLRESRAAAMLRLGMSSEAAEMILAMTMPQAIRFASSNFALCYFRLDEIPGVQPLAQLQSSSSSIEERLLAA